MTALHQKLSLEEKLGKQKADEEVETAKLAAAMRKKEKEREFDDELARKRMEAALARRTKEAEVESAIVRQRVRRLPALRRCSLVWASCSPPL